MTVPANIITELTNLQAQVKAANPIQAAPYATIKAIQLNAEQLETDTSAALKTAAGLLDTWTPPRDSFGIVSGFNTEVNSAIDQWHLYDMLITIGRANLNIDLLIGNVTPPIGATL